MRFKFLPSTTRVQAQSTHTINVFHPALHHSIRRAAVAFSSTIMDCCIEEKTAHDFIEAYHQKFTDACIFISIAVLSDQTPSATISHKKRANKQTIVIQDEVCGPRVGGAGRAFARYASCRTLVFPLPPSPSRRVWVWVFPAPISSFLVLGLG